MFQFCSEEEQPLQPRRNRGESMWRYQDADAELCQNSVTVGFPEFQKTLLNH